MYICKFCEESYNPHNDVFDHNDEGFWCECCDGFTYYDGLNHHHFTLLLESKSKEITVMPQVAVKFKKQLALMRYPGGKSKLISLIYSHLRKEKCKTLVSPYTGGGSAEFAFLEAGVVEKLILNDKDVGVYALYWVVKHMPEQLISRIRSCRPSHELYFEAQKIVKSDFDGCSLIEAAWYTLLVNRLAYSGIFKANPLGGRQGSKESLISRWNPEQLCRRVATLHRLSEHYEILNEDAIELIENEYWNHTSTIFIDPPYVAKGKDLYRHFYSVQEHYDLQLLLDSLHQGMPGADILLTYDDDPLIEQIYHYPTWIERVNRFYSA